MPDGEILKNTLLLLMLADTSLIHADTLDLHSHKQGTWEITSTARMHRWRVIHQLEQGNRTGIYHIEVLGRKHDDPSWQVQRLVRHMAITSKALLRSITKPLNKGGVYPEPFDDAYQQWQSLNNGKGGPVCQTSVIDCMPR